MSSAFLAWKSLGWHPLCLVDWQIEQTGPDGWGPGEQRCWVWHLEGEPRVLLEVAQLGALPSFGEQELADTQCCVCPSPAPWD